jgi:23S rRNA pseudouridine1911/1915/1917 synthase
MKPDILFENENFIILNKPSGLLTIPDRHDMQLPSLDRVLGAQQDKVWIVHRLDRETSGCVCFAKNELAHKHANLLFERRKLQKKYTAIVHGNVDEDNGEMNHRIMEHPTIKGKMMVHAKSGKEARTSFQVIERFSKYTVVECMLHTGRTHQLRVHWSNYGFPILCDSLYGSAQPIFVSSLKKNYHLSKLEEEERPLFHRLALHASSLQMEDIDGTMLSAEAPLPKDMQALLKQCRKWLHPKV